MKSTQENNRLIAEFLGWKENTDPTERFFGDWFDGFNRMTSGNKEPLLFHCNWNWLMPVVKKINSWANEQLTFAEYDDYRTSNWRMIYNPSKYDIKDVFNQIGQFIEWYNSKTNEK